MMDVEKILARAIRVIGEVFMVDTAGLGAKSCAVDVPGWDSVSQVMLVMRLEDEFNIYIESIDLDNAENLGDLSVSIMERLKSTKNNEEAR
jgi:acyl carrier protein